jgi:peptidoglycan/xylan/chitin deacetylase (PgdA/CDA1 family)
MASAGVDLVRRPPAGVVVLIYHRVGAHTPVSVDLPSELFSDQMAYLAAHHGPLALDAAADLLDGGGAAPARSPVVVTFDDGTADFVEDALPVLVAHLVPAVLYVATDHIERGVPFPDNGRPASWAALADAVSTGLVTIGSHTHSHRLLDRVDGPAAVIELDRSIGLIADRLGLACRHFAYPKAMPGSAGAEPEVRRRFRTAAVAGGRANRIGATDLHRLSRTPIQVADGLGWFRRKAAGGMALESDIRAMVDRRRYAQSTT